MYQGNTPEILIKLSVSTWSTDECVDIHAVNHDEFLALDQEGHLSFTVDLPVTQSFHLPAMRESSVPRRSAVAAWHANS